ncbi:MULTISPECIES: ankyrin repeat domain-containing protein [Shewanella]|uniref:ankyrin repeat domain-containing protein n=1 Tax=Shewanella TaxID=22 RepID=UPI000F514C6A|nr:MULTISPECIES: ankyrin repeat domain-containing protein [Shewanella]MBB1320383.1 ankyrin repeat domain-containing protein [Shewanella sp. SR43-8]RPA55865.1 ankyrin repeat domain-containing protein [Shewanella vesiculosa]UJL41143.1 ankyrin repeat domain-containing protein [Shewanella vesiculosa]|tara:strand:+ start:1342 stop:1866 length:525 start_codon:yes stop_codon:yes gene_type:complete
MRFKVLLGCVFITIILYSLGAIYSLENSRVEDVVLCSVEDNTHYIPNSFCEFYLFNFRLTKQDLDELQSASGIAFLFSISNQKKKYVYLDKFIENGASVNSKSEIDGLPPLHAAILLNDKKLVEYLLSKGSDPELLDSQNKLNAYDFVMLLKRNNDSINRNEVIRTLSTIDLAN